MDLTLNSALLVIDAQRIYTDSDSELFCKQSRKTISNINKLVDCFQKANRPIIYIRHMHAKDGSDIGRLFDYAGEFEDFNFKQGSSEVEYSPDLIRTSNSTELIKTRYSAFQKTTLHKVLEEHSIKRIVICGFMTNFCCESTAREAHDRDYYVTFVLDATGCPDLPGLPQSKIRDLVGRLLGSGFATIVSTSKFMIK